MSVSDPDVSRIPYTAGKPFAIYCKRGIIML
jgi:hypothetical protein